ncbi:MAG: hypothetical protein WCT19_03165 [Candidatus Paceibacterota bacterium]
MKRTTIEHQSAVSVWTNGRFCLTAGFYSGRPPSTEDLNSRILEMVYKGLKKDVSQEAATNFVRLVNGLSDLSASAFIVALRSFLLGGCSQVNIRQSKKDRIEIDNKDQAFAIIARVLKCPMMDESEIQRVSREIKEPFISQHLGEIPDEENR